MQRLSSLLITYVILYGGSLTILEFLHKGKWPTGIRNMGKQAPGM